MADLWHLGFSAWQIGDGHPNIAVGDEIDEAVECSIGDWTLLGQDAEPSARHLHETTYQVIAKLLARADPYLFDIGGLVVGSHGWPKESFDRRTQIAIGDFIEAEFTLGIDPMGLSSYAPDLPIDRRWLVRRVRALDGPWIQFKGGYIRDMTRSTWLEIDSTEHHLVTAGTFVLDCELGRVSEVIATTS